MIWALAITVNYCIYWHLIAILHKYVLRTVVSRSLQMVEMCIFLVNTMFSCQFNCIIYDVWPTHQCKPNGFSFCCAYLCVCVWAYVFEAICCSYCFSCAPALLFSLFLHRQLSDSVVVVVLIRKACSEKKDIFCVQCLCSMCTQR